MVDFFDFSFLLFLTQIEEA